jgi:hypothetical protein
MLGGKHMIRLRKIARSVNLGDLIDTNKAYELIKEKLGTTGLDVNNIKNDIANGGAEAILGLISDNGLVAAELYCFKQSDGLYKGVVVGAKLNVDENNNTNIEDYDCILLNSTENQTISQLSNTMIAGINICGMQCTFKNKIKNLEQLYELV